MSSGSIGLGHPSAPELERMLAIASASSLTYDHVGSTMPPVDTRRPIRQRHLVLGHGPEAFQLAVLGLRRWSCHEGIRATVSPKDASIDTGTSLLVVLNVGPAHIVVPNRVVAVMDEARRFGFAYGTLEGHQERGEESFLAELLDDGTVRGTISADAIAATLPARMAAPAVVALQRLAIDRYLNAWRSFVTRAEAEQT